MRTACQLERAGLDSIAQGLRMVMIMMFMMTMVRMTMVMVVVMMMSIRACWA